MPEYYDIYALARERTLTYIQRFLDSWAKDCDEIASEYEYPHFSSVPEQTYFDLELLLQRLVETPDATYSIYWDCRERYKAKPMLFFTTDGEMIVGLSKDTSLYGDYHQLADSLLLEDLKKLAECVDGKTGCVLFEQAPPDSAHEFRLIPDLNDFRLVIWWSNEKH